MTNNLRLRRFAVLPLLFIALLAFTSTGAFASHLRGTTISWAPTAVATMPAAIFATALLGIGSSPELSIWLPSGMARHQNINNMLAAPSRSTRSGNPRSISTLQMWQGALTLDKPLGFAGLGASTVRTHRQARQVRPRAPR